MVTKEETEKLLDALRQELKGQEATYQFFIPGWAPESSSMGFRWMQSQLWEGFKVTYKIDQQAKHVYLKCWEFGESEPAW
jgi:hypothetical protein